MASFTYTVWCNCSPMQMFLKIEEILLVFGFVLRNPTSGMCHLWDGEGNPYEVATKPMINASENDLPLGIQFWRGEDDIFLTLALDEKVGGSTAYVRLVGLTRAEEAEIAKQLIEHVIPHKRDFPDDYSVFTLDAR